MSFILLMQRIFYSYLCMDLKHQECPQVISNTTRATYQFIWSSFVVVWSGKKLLWSNSLISAGCSVGTVCQLSLSSKHSATWEFCRLKHAHMQLPQSIWCTFCRTQVWPAPGEWRWLKTSTVHWHLQVNSSVEPEKQCQHWDLSYQ